MCEVFKRVFINNMAFLEGSEQGQIAAAADAVGAVSSCQQQQPHPVQEQPPQQQQQSTLKQTEQQQEKKQLIQEQHQQQQQQQPQSVYEQPTQIQQSIHEQPEQQQQQPQSGYEQSEHQQQQKLQQHLMEQQTQTAQQQKQQLNICPAQTNITLLQKNTQKPPSKIKNNPRSKRRHRAKIKETISEKGETYQLKDDPKILQIDKPILDSDLSLIKNNPSSNRIRQVDIPDEKFLLTEENSEVEDYVSIKAKLVVRGDKDETEDDIPGDSPTVDRNTVKLPIATAAIMGWPLRSVDISAASSQGKDIVGLHESKETTRLWFENQNQSQHPEKLTEVHRDAEKATKDKKKTTLRGVVGKLPTRPDLSLRTNILSHIPAGTNLDEKIKKAREPVEEARRKPPEIKDEKIGSLENSSLERYASFGGVEKGIRNTEGLIILLREDDSRCEPIAWRSQVVSRVGRSVKTDETVALEDALNRATGIGRQVIQNQTGKTQEIPIPVRACIDSNSLVESLKQQLVTETEWVPTHLQRTDPLTKAKADTTALIRILKSGFLRRPG